MRACYPTAAQAFILPLGPPPSASRLTCPHTLPFTNSFSHFQPQRPRRSFIAPLTLIYSSTFPKLEPQSSVPVIPTLKPSSDSSTTKGAGPRQSPYAGSWYSASFFTETCYSLLVSCVL
ncbi:hypothetical protein EJ04DRAFT_308948 [Polyplosphaeria fusca]|uniref:Uncharacterized protein n=1 Tax=Polyplosphaeria fusca TaxID=682080 RepID=A0A9P4R763_9PLEO|nr:hypothetical protein EJ04DRAFT_308948 [Polyplosphaeria fusca]